jgi:hypothetical protein
MPKNVDPATASSQAQLTSDFANSVAQYVNDILAQQGLVPTQSASRAAPISAQAAGGDGSCVCISLMSSFVARAAT